MNDWNDWELIGAGDWLAVILAHIGITEDRINCLLSPLGVRCWCGKARRWLNRRYYLAKILNCLGIPCKYDNGQPW